MLKELKGSGASGSGSSMGRCGAVVAHAAGWVRRSTVLSGADTGMSSADANIMSARPSETRLQDRQACFSWLFAMSETRASV